MNDCIFIHKKERAMKKTLIFALLFAATAAFAQPSDSLTNRAREALHTGITLSSLMDFPERLTLRLTFDNDGSYRLHVVENTGYFGAERQITKSAKRALMPMRDELAEEFKSGKLPREVDFPLIVVQKEY